MALTKLVVNLNGESIRAIARMREHGLDSKMDSINRAIQLYAWWLEQETAGYTHHVRNPEGRISQPIRME